VNEPAIVEIQNATPEDLQAYLATLTPDELAALEHRFKEQLKKDDLIEFACAIDPRAAKNYRTRHLIRIAKELERIERGEINRLFVTCPPRHWKSSLISEKFVTWFLGRNPESSVGIFSHGAGLPTRFGVNVRKAIEFNPRFKAIFPEVKVAGGNTSEWSLKGAFRTTLSSLGVLCSPTGVGFDCLLGNTLVTTTVGDIPISSLQVVTSSCKVLAYEERENQLCWKRIKAIAHRESDGYYRITTASGRVVEASANHPFYTGAGYTKAHSISVGDNLLLALRQGAIEDGVRNEQVVAERRRESLLFAPMLLSSHERIGRQERTQVCRMRQSDYESGQVLQPAMQGESGCSKDVGDAQEKNKTVPGLRQGVHCLMENGRMLQSEMRRETTLETDGRKRQSMLPGRDSGDEREGQGSEVNAKGDFEKGLDGVCRMRFDNRASRSSHKSQCHGHQNGEHGNALPEVSRNIPRSGAFKTERDTVAMVEFIREPTTVWNIQVEGTENFFANGVLTHNCIIIDDPISDAFEAYSPTALEKVWLWYKETLRDRLNPGGKIVMVMSRWHQNDPAGHVLRESATGEGEHWDELRLPAIAEKNDPLGRDEGEALWPEVWPLTSLMAVKKAQGARGFAARFQGTPRADQGNMMNSTHLVMRDASEMPEHFVKLCRRWDLAFSEARGADFMAGAKMGLDRFGNRWIIHIKRVKGRWPQGVPVIKTLAEEDGQSCSVLIEANGTQLGYAQQMKEDIPNRIVLEDHPEGSKEMRAMVWATRLQDGIIFCVRGEWNQEFFDEMDFFPAGEHDDMVDAVSGGWKFLGEPDGAINERNIGGIATGGSLRAWPAARSWKG
jgi:predicted phage terminase large subunit-like protein